MAHHERFTHKTRFDMDRCEKNQCTRQMAPKFRSTKEMTVIRAATEM
jgi:hypothetical protein